jgi:hypothetical protein
VRPLRLVSAALAVGAGSLSVAACGSPSATTSTTAAPVTTTTASAAQTTVLTSLLLTTTDFPTGWTQDTRADAADTSGTPACVADLVLVRGSTDRADAVFVGPGDPPPAVIQTVAAFAPGSAARSVAALRADFDSCNGRTVSSGETGVQVGIRPLPDPPAAGDGFTAQMTLTEGERVSYLDVFYGVRDGSATFLGWSSSSPDTATFLELSAAAVAKL